MQLGLLVTRQLSGSDNKLIYKQHFDDIVNNMSTIKMLLSALVLLSACRMPDFTLSPGIEVNLNGYNGATQEEMQIAVDEIVADTKRVFPDVDFQSKFNPHAFLSFEPGLSDCAEHHATCPTKMVGWTDGAQIVVHFSVQDTPGHYVTDAKAPLKMLAFKHEIAHVFLIRTGVVPPAQQDQFINTNFGY
jgi:hypothetical protein